VDGESGNEKAKAEEVKSSSARTDDPVAQADAVRDPLIGTVVGGRFEIEEVLGIGGMSVVYKARQLNVNRYVAIKTIRVHVDSKPVYRERFQREIDSLFTLSHPNIVTVYDCIIGSDEQPYVVMDYLRGRSLEKLLMDGPLNLERFARIALQICSALDHAHKKGVIHRDLKPGNILLMDDEMDFVKVVDFGLVKLREEESRKLTQSGELWGSPPYMSPEQCVGESGDERSDIYSLGCVMYHMLTGRDPFWDAKSVFELIQCHVKKPPRAMRKANAELFVSPALEAVIMRCLEKNPICRFQAAHELQDALVQAMAGPAVADVLLHSPVVTKTRLPIVPYAAPAEMRPQVEEGQGHYTEQDHAPSPLVRAAEDVFNTRPQSKWARPASGQQVVSKWAPSVSGQNNISKWAGIVSGARNIQDLSAGNGSTALEMQKPPQHQSKQPAIDIDPARANTINAYSQSFNLVLIALVLIGFSCAVYIAYDNWHRPHHNYKPVETSSTPANSNDADDQLYFTPNQILHTPEQSTPTLATESTPKSQAKHVRKHNQKGHARH